MTKKILVVAAHPDDEILGCGGTIAAHTLAGDQVHVVIMAEGLTSRDLKRDAVSNYANLSVLADVTHQSNALLGVVDVVMHGLPDNRMDSLDRLNVTKLIEQEIDRVCPDTVYTHHAGDLNFDHRIVHECVLTACRPKPGHPVKTLLFFEVPSSTEWMPATSGPSFTPNWFVNITGTMELKLKAMDCYASEMCDWPHARSIKAIEHLAGWRGASIGVDAAEAFILGRRIID